MFYFYLLINIIFTIVYSYTGYLGGDFANLSIISNIYSLVLSLFIFIIIVYFILKIVFPFIENKIKIKKHFKYEKSSLLNYIFLIISLFFLFCSIIGISNHRVDHSQLNYPPALFYLYTLISPQYLLLIYIFYSYKSNSKIFFFIIIITIIASYLSGSSFTLIYLLPLYILREDKKIKIKKLLTLLLLGIAIYPIFRFFKYALNSMFNLTSSFDMIELDNYISSTLHDNSLLELYIYFLQLSVERFQVVSNISYIIDQSDILYSLSQNYNIQNIDFFIFRTIENIFFNNKNNEFILQKLVAININGLQTWSSHISLAGFFIIEGVNSITTYLYVVILLLFSILLSKLLSSNSRVIELTWINTLLFICHGWLSPFTYYVYSLLVFIMIIIFCDLLKRAR
ncbi:oligosaccharide repeat unit polymerase [Proteus mirabilis]|uniref:oligosaccharide repeat unit polymerase n=1 Tax=Proteus mirabilis TaxID=584 RepID=UPI0019810038|nr:oligosaccharide repeat unit polymerase [Proteus mirabilis]QUY06544.1 oligosaccharide repeat unit polymerase [Proteus mirabilis]